MSSSEEPKQKDSCLMKPHFLKPSINGGSVADLPPLPPQSFSLSSKESDVLSKKICEKGFRFANPDFISWAKKMEALHEPTWKKAGIFEAIKASTYRISSDPSLVLALVEKWCPETKSFIFPWGEATVTLEDVMVVLEFPVLGGSVFAPLESLEMREAVKEMEKGRLQNMTTDYHVAPKKWFESFRSRDDEIEHDAFLAMWLSLFVFPIGWRSSISRDVFPIAVRLARGEKLALAPAVLASLYRDLGLICGIARDKSTLNVSLKSLFKLVQVWIWERFGNIRPEALELQKGEPRIAQWSFEKQGCEKKESVCFDDFEWRPYVKPLKNWSLPRFYLEESKWISFDDSLDEEFVSYARCLRVSQLVGIGCVEDYYPHRVARQFGFSQYLAGMVTDYSNFTEKEAWDDYNKSLDGSKLYIPSRLATTFVTRRYQDWWLKSVSESLSSQESSQVFQKLGEGFPAKLKRCRKRVTAKNVRWEMKERKIGDWCGSGSREVPLSELFQKELGKRKRKHLRNKRAHDDDDDETVAPQGREQRSEENDDVEETGSKAEKEPECVLLEDGAIVGQKESSGEKEDDVADDNSLIQQKLAVDNDGDNGSLTIAQMMRRKSNKYSDVKNGGGDSSEPLVYRSRLVADINDSDPRQNLDSIRADGDETGSDSGKNMVLSSFEENNSSGPPLGFGKAINVVVSPPEKRQTCEDELDAFGGIPERMTIIDDGSKEAECLLLEDVAIIAREKVSSSEKGDDSVCDDKLIDDGTKEPESLLPEDGAVVVEKARSGDEKKDDNKLIDNGSKEPECLLREDGAVFVENASSGEKEVVDDILIDARSKEPEYLLPEEGAIVGEKMSSGEKEVDADDNSLIQQKLDAFGSNPERMTIIDDGSKELECLLLEDVAIIAGEKVSSSEKADDSVCDDKLIDDGTMEQESLLPEDVAIIVVEKASSDEKEVDDDIFIDARSKEPGSLLPEEGAIVGETTSSVEKEHDDNSLIQQKLAIEELALKEPTPRQKLANGDETTKASDESNIHIAVRSETQGHDNALGSEKTTNEQLEKRNEEAGEGDVGNDSHRKSLLKLKDSYQEFSHELKSLDSTIDALILKVERNMAWLKEQRAIRMRELAAPRLI